MKISRRPGKRRAMASIVGAVIFFLMVFTVGTGYFLFVNSSNLNYNHALSARSQGSQSQVLVNLQLSAWRSSSTGYLFLNITNTGGTGANVTDVFISTPSGATPSNTVCSYGIGVLSVVSGCPNPGASPPVCPAVGGNSIVSTYPCLPLSLSAGATVTSIVTGLAISTGTYTIKVVTQNGNTFTTTYPAPVPNIPLTALQAQSAGGLTVNLASFKWFALTQAAGMYQDAYVPNCNSKNCAGTVGSGNSPVNDGDLLVFGLGWPGSSSLLTSATPSDSFSDTFTVGPQESVKYHPFPSVLPNQNLYSTTGCTSTSCSLAFPNAVTAGNTLVFGLGWAGYSTVPTISDTRGNSFTQAAAQSLASTASPTMAQTPASSSSASCTSCSLSFPNSVGAGDTIVFTIGWTCGYSSCTPTISDSAGMGDTFTSAVSQRAGSNPYYFSRIWYAQTVKSGSDTITASNFGGSGYTATHVTMSVYELSGASISSITTSTSPSSSGSSSVVTSFSLPASNSMVIGAVVTSGSTTISAGTGSGYTTVGCGSGVYGCSEYQGSLSASQTVPFSFTATETYSETAVAFAPTTYYSYIWIATAGSSNTDTITATFGTPILGSISIYEISGATTTGYSVQYGSSSTAFASFSGLAANSTVIGNMESASTTYTAGSGYTLVYSSGGCSSVRGCSEYQAGVSGSQTVQFTLGSVPWVESAIAFSQAPATYYNSYIWYGLAGGTSTTSDTITATFSTSVAGSISIYELSGYSTSNILTEVGGTTFNSINSLPAVTPFTPISNSIIIGNTEAGSTYLVSQPTYTQGSGYTLIQSCSSGNGCSEYQTGSQGVQTTVPMSLSVSVPWAESAIAFSAQPIPSSGAEVGGYPALGVPTGTTIVFEVTFTNNDPQQRSVTIWPQSALGLQSICSNQYWHNCGGGWYFEDIPFYIVDGLNSGYTAVNAYAQPFVVLPYGVPVTLYFGANAPLSSTTNGLNNWAPEAPFEAMFTLLGQYSDGSLYGQTIPFPAGTVTGANAYTQPVFGSTGSTITVSCIPTGQYQQNSCNFMDSVNLLVGWINSAGKITTLSTACSTNSQGDINSGCTFTVPSASAGFYTIIVSDYVNTVFMTFQHT